MNEHFKVTIELTERDADDIERHLPARVRCAAEANAGSREGKSVKRSTFVVFVTFEHDENDEPCADALADQVASDLQSSGALCASALKMGRFGIDPLDAAHHAHMAIEMRGEE